MGVSVRVGRADTFASGSLNTIFDGRSGKGARIKLDRSGVGHQALALPRSLKYFRGGLSVVRNKDAGTRFSSLRELTMYQAGKRADSPDR